MSTSIAVDVQTALAVGTTPIGSGTSGKILYDAAGVLGEATVGTGLSLAAGTLTASGSGGTVTSVATAGLATGGPITTTGTVTVTAASQSDQETGTSTSVAVTPGVQKYHPSAAKAWVSFQGTGTVTILASYNVSSITDNGTGDYTVNFTTAFSSANYASAAVNGRGVASVNARQTGAPATADPTASAFRISTANNSGTIQDSEFVSAVFFGDQ